MSADAAPPPAATLRGPAVLVVDDHALMRDLIAGICKSLGFPDVDTCADGAEALRMLRRKSYRLILADLQMEPVTGLELLQAVRSDETLKDVLFLIMTARLDMEAVVSARELGVDNYLIKPFTRDQLKGKLLAVLAPDFKRRRGVSARGAPQT